MILVKVIIYVLVGLSSALLFLHEMDDGDDTILEPRFYVYAALIFFLWPIIWPGFIVIAVICYTSYVIGCIYEGIRE